MKKTTLCLIAAITWLLGSIPTTVIASKTNDGIVFGPGKAHLTVSFDGGWGGFAQQTPAGTIDLITRGGFVLIAENSEGVVDVVVNTRGMRLKAADAVRDLGLRAEGAIGGFRAPSLRPDDDNDGEIDEDRLDGVDNDGDGRVDEDYAAIGDEMFVTEFEHHEGKAHLVFHAEYYAWSLPHIDGTIMVNLTVKNLGDETIENVVMGSIVEPVGPLAFERRSVGGSRSRALTCTDESGAAIALVGLSHDSGSAGWFSGAFRTKEDAVNLSGLVRRLVRERDLDMVGPMRHDETGSSDATSLYFVSPPVEVMAPGDEIRFEIAIAGIGAGGDVDRTIRNAVRTYEGDGVHRYLPLPVSMTPKLIWGAYRSSQGASPRIAITLDGDVEDAIDVRDISYLNGIASDDVELREIVGGVVELVISGDVATRALQRSERLTLKGRLRSGEFFEAILRPVGPEGELETDGDATPFFASPGKLAPELLAGSPNPFRGATTISYEIPRTVEQDDGTRLRSEGPFATSVKIYNVAGRLVNTVHEAETYPGQYTHQWDATDVAGNPVASGVYYIRLQIDQKFITKRFTLLK